MSWAFKSWAIEHLCQYCRLYVRQQEELKQVRSLCRRNLSLSTLKSAPLEGQQWGTLKSGAYSACVWVFHSKEMSGAERLEIHLSFTASTSQLHNRALNSLHARICDPGSRNLLSTATAGVFVLTSNVFGQRPRLTISKGLGVPHCVHMSADYAIWLLRSTDCQM
jgi:hypothetical protein